MRRPKRSSDVKFMAGWIYGAFIGVVLGDLIVYWIRGVSFIHDMFNQ